MMTTWVDCLCWEEAIRYALILALHFPEKRVYVTKQPGHVLVQTEDAEVRDDA